MLADLSAKIGGTKSPNAWMIVDRGKVTGLISLVAEPVGETISIGYGIAESERGRGLASGAVGLLLELMRADASVSAVRAETGVDNPASQKVLIANGFDRTGTRCDPEDGDLVCWSKQVSC